MTSEETSIRPGGAMGAHVGDWDRHLRRAGPRGRNAAYWIAAVVVTTAAIANWWIAIGHWQWGWKGWKPLSHEAAIATIVLELCWWLVLARHLARIRGRGDLNLRLLVLAMAGATGWLIQTLPELRWLVIFFVVDAVLSLDVGHALRGSSRRTIALFGRLLWWSGLLNATVFLMPFAPLPALAARTVIAYEMVTIALGRDKRW